MPRHRHQGYRLLRPWDQVLAWVYIVVVMTLWQLNVRKTIGRDEEILHALGRSLQGMVQILGDAHVMLFFAAR